MVGPGVLLERVEEPGEEFKRIGRLVQRVPPLGGDADGLQKLVRAQDGLEGAGIPDLATGLAQRAPYRPVAR